MGYTHYWRKPGGIPAAAWALIQEDAAALIAASPVKIAFRYVGASATNPQNPTKSPDSSPRQSRAGIPT